MIADSISNRLVFINASKKQGSMPMGPSGSSLKISVKDTLYLMDEIKVPIRFLHMDTTKDVAGAYVQFHGGSFYYIVPEVEDLKDNDTVSVILMGFDTRGLPVPFGGVPPAGPGSLTFDITITAYDVDGLPVAQTTRPVKISNQPNNPSSSPCGLVLAPGEFWDWQLTLIEDTNTNRLVFYNDFDKVWGAGGQFIKGCCINGKSSYNINCSADTAHHRTLLFPTSFQFAEESLKFFDDGTFARFTKQLHNLPDPDLSDFCGSGKGVVHGVTNAVSYFGTYTINTLATPFQGDSLSLSMFTTSKSGGSGYGRSGGVIHQLDCVTLALIQPDREGFGRHDVSYFTRTNLIINMWFDML